MRPSGIVTLITDFGLQGAYVGAIKGAVLAANPRGQVVDISNQITPQDLLEASFVLKNAYPYFPPGTVHLVVVDPGVGTRRRPLALSEGGHLFVGPDNGVFTGIFSEKTTGREITRRDLFLTPLSETFHGRDLFAPVAGHISRGMAIKTLGPLVRDFVRLSWPEPRLVGKELKGQILWADSFGNLITNICRLRYGEVLEDRPVRLRVGRWRTNRIRRTYAEVQPGEALALFGSSGLLEIAVNRGSARQELKIRPEAPITISLLKQRGRE